MPVDLSPPGPNPLESDDPRSWDGLVEAMGVPSLLVVIQRRMSDKLRARLQPEDILQEALLHAWRSRGDIEWRGLPAFRAWFLRVIDNRIWDAADREHAQKRGNGRVVVLSALQPDDGHSTWPGGFEGPLASTTPSRAAAHREQAEQMLAALQGLPDELREVVRLRLFEERSTGETARELGLGISATKHRFRKGALLYERQLAAVLGSRSGMDAQNP